MSEFAASDETLLLLLDEQQARSGDAVSLSYLAQLGEVGGKACLEALRRLEQRGLVRVADATAYSRESAAVVTAGGKEEAAMLNVPTPLGPVAEFVGGLGDLQRAVLDDVVEQEQRIRGPAITRSDIRMRVRVHYADVTAETVTQVINDLSSRSYLQVAGENHHGVMLRGLLASRWGLNAIHIVDGTLQFLGTRSASKSPRRNYSWRTLRKAAALHQGTFNLAYLSVTLTGLGGGLFPVTDEMGGGLGWVVPDDLDILLERAQGSALLHIHSVLASTDADGDAAERTKPALGARLASGETPRSGETRPAPPPETYDVAISYAGEDVLVAGELASLLRHRGLDVFFGEEQRAELLGRNLHDELHAIYGARSRFGILIASRHYATKPWAALERQAMQARAFERSAEDSLLVLRLDDTPIPGLLATMSYETPARGLERIADLVVAKLGRSTAPRPASATSAAKPHKPLVALGPAILAEGDVIGTHGTRWTLEVGTFVRGDQAVLAALGTTFAAAARDDRYVVVQSLGMGAVLAAPIRWERKNPVIVVDCEVAPLHPRTSIHKDGSDLAIDMTRVPFRFDPSRRVSGVERMAQQLSFVLSWCKGGWGAGCEHGSHVPRWVRDHGQERLADFIAIEIARIAAVTYYSTLDRSDAVVFPAIERVLAVELCPPPADGWCAADVTLRLAGLEPSWTGTIHVCLSTGHLGPKPDRGQFQP
jgi:hypothetical protein